VTDGSGLAGQPDLFEEEATRSLLDQLLIDWRLYRTTQDYNELLDFVVRLRNVAPFNAMLLQLQKPGLRFASSAFDWRERFGRTIKEGARPLLILWPFGPVAIIYDVQDAEGERAPEDVNCFVARGQVDEPRFLTFKPKLEKRNIQWHEFDGGDAKAGYVRVIRPAISAEEPTIYRMLINRNHPIAVRFVTLSHELAHVFLGHLGQDKALVVPRRQPLTHAEQELEAESVAYVVAARNGVTSKSETYLSNFVQQRKCIDDLNVYQIMRAAGQVETVLGLTSHTRFDSPGPRTSA
jgi:hypothetical protein